MKTKIARIIGLKKGSLPNGQPNFENLFFHPGESNGTEVEIDEKKLKSIEATQRKFLRDQKFLADLWEGKGA